MKLAELIQQAYAEDMPQGDLTTDSLNVKERLGRARLLAKEDLVLAGREVFEACVRHISPTTDFNWQFKDSDLVLNKQTVCWLKGNLIELLKAERVALNFLGRLSGIASLTRCFVQEAQGTKCKILDTRKTTPLYRSLEKKAVRAGGGHNHRMNLSESILLKDNHLRAVGGLAQAVAAVRETYSGFIEVECSTLEEVKTAVELRVSRILLDNMSTALMHEARQMIPAIIEVEASGNMNLKRIREVAETGVDFISVGALTHSAPCADFSLLFEWTASEGT
jgi:nicotinate-nucleotide pyrophosphorylase (carboxylating)